MALSEGRQGPVQAGDLTTCSDETYRLIRSQELDQTTDRPRGPRHTGAGALAHTRRPTLLPHPRCPGRRPRGQRAPDHREGRPRRVLALAAPAPGGHTTRRPASATRTPQGKPHSRPLMAQAARPHQGRRPSLRPHLLPHLHHPTQLGTRTAAQQRRSRPHHPAQSRRHRHRREPARHLPKLQPVPRQPTNTQGARHPSPRAAQGQPRSLAPSTASREPHTASKQQAPRAPSAERRAPRAERRTPRAPQRRTAPNSASP